MKQTQFTIIAALAVIVGLGGAPGFAQTRVFVSGSGSDSNPCSLAAPCRSFQQAHNTVLAGGEIVALDAAGYGPLSISKAITVTAIGIEASITSNSTNAALSISAGANDDVAIRGLTVIAGSISSNGVGINGGKSVRLRHCSISGFSNNGIFVTPTANIDVELHHVTSVGNVGDGLRVIPSGSGKVTMLVTDSALNGNSGNGVQLNGTSSTGAINATLNVDAAANGNRGILVTSASGQAQAVVMVTGSKLVNNATGGLSGVSNAAQVFVDRTQITGNGANGWEAVSSATVDSYTNNEVNGNASDGLNGVIQIGTE